MLLKRIGFFLGPALFVLLLALPNPAGLDDQAWKAIALTAFMLTWYISEAMPLPVTALLPMVVLPLSGLETNLEQVLAPYANPVVYLFMGGFVIALAMERWNLHRRIALNILRITGVNANGIILGFFLATALLSMWISNTATTMMMLPIALSVITLVQGVPELSLQGVQRFALSLMLGVSYASSIGGVATIIGSPPNVVAVGQLKKLFGREISFLDWMAMGAPYALILLLLGYLAIVHWVYPNRLGKIPGVAEKIKDQLTELGPLSRGEWLTLGIFLMAAVGWVFKAQFKLLWGVVLDETVVAILAALALFLLPVDFRQWRFVLEWKDTAKLPWGILLLFGAGFCMAETLSKTGIIEMIGARFSVSHTESWLFVAGLVTVTVFLTELLSNVALVQVFVPVMGAVAVGLGLDPLLLCLPVTLAASSGFMLPMSTPPNAIVFASGHLTVGQMMRAGLILNVLSIVLMTILGQWIIPLLF